MEADLKQYLQDCKMKMVSSLWSIEVIQEGWRHRLSQWKNLKRKPAVFYHMKCWNYIYIYIYHCVNWLNTKNRPSQVNRKKKLFKNFFFFDWLMIFDESLMFSMIIMIYYLIHLLFMFCLLSAVRIYGTNKLFLNLNLNLFYGNFHKKCRFLTHFRVHFCPWGRRTLTGIYFTI